MWDKGNNTMIFDKRKIRKSKVNKSIKRTNKNWMIA